MFTIDEAAHLLDTTPELVEFCVEMGLLTLDKDSILRAAQVTNPEIWAQKSSPGSHPK